VKTKVSPAIIGAFVIGAFALAIVGLLFFGGVNFFSKPQRFVVFFDESVNGLGLGAPVKLSGVPVGRVVSLGIRYDEAGSRSQVVVVCEFSKDVMRDNRGQLINVADRATLENLVNRGLRAQLGVQGLATGLLYVGLEFMDPKDYPPSRAATDPRYAVVPDVPSTISEFQASASEILSSLQKVDFAGLSRSLAVLLADVRKQVDGLDLKGTVEQWRRTGTQVEALAANLARVDAKATADNLNAAVADLRRVIANVDAQVGPSGAELREALATAKKTIESFSATAETARTFITAHGSVADDLAETLGHLNEAADAVKRFADFLERNPNALITGRKRPQ
jgi:paraquat-inducible protein B